MDITTFLTATGIALYTGVGVAFVLRYYLDEPPLPGKSRSTRAVEALRLFLVWPVYIHRAYQEVASEQ